jgi:hypothetical protein
MKTIALEPTLSHICFSFFNRFTHGTNTEGKLNEWQFN